MSRREEPAASQRQDLRVPLNEARSKVIAEMWQDFEIAMFGKIGNTWEVNHAARVNAFFERLAERVADVGQHPLIALVANWRNNADSLAALVKYDTDKQMPHLMCASGIYEECANGLARALASTHVAKDSAEEGAPDHPNVGGVENS
jgi:hypothetical protein